MKKKVILILIAIAFIGGAFATGYFVAELNKENNNSNQKEEKKPEKDNKEDKEESKPEETEKPNEEESKPDKEENGDKTNTESVSVVYEIEEYNTKNQKGTIVTKNSRNIPKITFSTNQKVATKIEKSLKEISDDEWNSDIKSEANRTSKSEEYQNLNEYEGLGAKLYFKDPVTTKQIITFTLSMEGSFGGTGWYEFKSYSYDMKTGEQLSLKSLTNNYNNFEKVILSEINNKLKTIGAEVYSEETTKEELIEHINETGNWQITEKGITIIFQKGEIADEATGAIEVAIEKSKINQYLKDEYKF